MDDVTFEIDEEDVAAPALGREQREPRASSFRVQGAQPDARALRLNLFDRRHELFLRKNTKKDLYRFSLNRLDRRDFKELEHYLNSAFLFK